MSNEVDGWDDSVKEYPQVTVGDLNLAESRLMLMVKGVKGIVYVASHQMDPLWRDDGIVYHTLVVSPAIEPSKTLSSELHAALNFIKAHKPALICSSCPKMRAVVAAACMQHAVPIAKTETTLERLRDVHVLTEPLGAPELEALEQFAASVASVESAGASTVAPPPGAAFGDAPAPSVAFGDAPAPPMAAFGDAFSKFPPKPAASSADPFSSAAADAFA